MRRSGRILVAFFIVCLAIRSGLAQTADTVQSILAHCNGCHAGAKPTAGLSLKTREAALRGGKSGPALEPGNADNSPIYKMVSAREMPPGSPLSDPEIALFREWIINGAPWIIGGEPQRAGPDWWALQPVAGPPAPAVKDSAWVQNPIDTFVLAKLEAKGLAPSAPASRATLIRRLTFDLTGLPATPEEIDAFVSDDSPDAYPRLVDRLLASPRYGERWGRH